MEDKMELAVVFSSYSSFSRFVISKNFTTFGTSDIDTISFVS